MHIEMEVKGLMINTAYRFRIYLNKAQSLLIYKTFGCSHFICNDFLSRCDYTYKEKGTTYGTCSAKLPVLRTELVWLKKLIRIKIQPSVRNFTDV
ncbi:transposase [Bacillus thuringiensis]|nr:transposase [Bacillus thuringiensis]PGY63537.1 transposase [Bacillus thuringiensis]